MFLCLKWLPSLTSQAVALRTSIQNSMLSTKMRVEFQLELVILNKIFSTHRALVKFFSIYGYIYVQLGYSNVSKDVCRGTSGMTLFHDGLVCVLSIG